MQVEFRLPDLGEGIHEGEIVEVLVRVGDSVQDGQTILIVETDKASTEVPSPVTGTVKEIRVKAGDLAKVGDVLMVFEQAGNADVHPQMEKGEQGRPEPLEQEKKDARTAEMADKTGREAEGAKEQAAQAPVPETGKAEGPVPAAPSTRRLARELGVDLRQVKPTGDAGRVTQEDVQAFAAKGKEPPEAGAGKEKAEKAAPRPIDIEAPELPDFSKWGPVDREPVRSIRRATLRQMTIAWSQVPHVSHQDVADITAMNELRQRQKAAAAERGGSLSMTVFALKAAASALKQFPRVNSSLDTRTGEIILKRYYHIGIAVDTDRGLIVPVVRDVDRKSIADLSVEVAEIAKRTREGTITHEEMTGGSFTITNIGPLGGTGFAPIVNFPQVAIMGMARARMQPVVRGEGAQGRIVPRLMLPLILGFDHRVIDGADAARFVTHVIRMLEDPERMLVMMS